MVSYPFEEVLKNRLGFSCAYPAGYTIHREGDGCDSVGMLIKGEVELVHHTINGDRLILGSVEEGSFYGDFLIFSSTPYYPGDLITRTDAQVIFIDRKNLEALLAESHAFRSYYLENLGDKALRFNFENKLLKQPTIEAKLRFLLESAHARTGEAVYEHGGIDRLAERLNVRRPSLSRELNRMRREGLIDYDRRVLRMQLQEKKQD